MSDKLLQKMLRELVRGRVDPASLPASVAHLVRIGVSESAQFNLLGATTASRLPTL